MACWNALGACAGLGAVAVAGEAYLRLAHPFQQIWWRPTVYLPGVGNHLAVHAEVWHTNRHDHWTVSRTNSLGFLDREPPSPQVARAGCHVAFVGDSFVEAAQVGIADKFHVRLEEMAAERLPALGVTTAAYGHANTGQVQQLPYWETWIRSRIPRLLVLVFVSNDFRDNARGGKVAGPRAQRTADGGISLLLPGEKRPPARVSAVAAMWNRIPRASRPHLMSWLAAKYRDRRTGGRWTRRPLAAYWSPGDMDFTAFALDEWQARAERDGAALVILSSSTVRTGWGATSVGFWAHLTRVARDRGIPVVDQYDYILRQGGVPRDSGWPRDDHWSPRGHQWAAEAMLEWLAANPAACGA